MIFAGKWARMYSTGALMVMIVLAVLGSDHPSRVSPTILAYRNETKFETMQDRVVHSHFRAWCETAIVFRAVTLENTPVFDVDLSLPLSNRTNRTIVLRKWSRLGCESGSSWIRAMIGRLGSG